MKKRVGGTLFSFEWVKKRAGENFFIKNKDVLHAYEVSIIRDLRVLAKSD